MLRSSLKSLGLFAACLLGLSAPAQAQLAPTALAELQSLPPSVLHLGDPMADLSAPQVRMAAQASPLFLAEIDHASLVQTDATDLVLAEGAELNLSRYLRSTQIRDQVVTRVALENPQALGLAGDITVVEDVFVLEDRLIVSREATIPVTRATCRGVRRAGRGLGRANGPVARARSELCLRPANPQRVLSEGQQPVLLDPAAELTAPMRNRVTDLNGGLRLIAPPTEADITEAADEVRAELRQMSPSSLFRHDVTVAEALGLDDAELLRLDADGEERVITHVSIIPLVRNIQPGPVTDRLPEAALPRAGEGFNQPIGPRLDQLPSALQPHRLTRRGQFMPRPQVQQLPPGALMDEPQRSGERAMVRPRPQLGPQPTLNGRILRGEREELNREVRAQRIRHEGSTYFITGFTLSEEIEERHKVTFNKRRNYFIAFKYRVGYRAGLRFPFEVNFNTESGYRTSADTGRWGPSFTQLDIAAVGVDGDARGIYAAAGMAPELIAGDREFTFGVWAWCQLQVRLPVIKTVRVNCPSVNVPRPGRCPNWACADFTPPIGREQRLASPRIPANVSGLQINAWVARAGVEPGVNIYARNAQFSLLASPSGNARFMAEPNRAQSCERTNGPAMRYNELLVDGACRIVFDGRSQQVNTGASEPAMRLNLDVTGASIPALRLSDPRYAFTMEFVPVLELFAELDVAVASWRVDKEIEIPGLTISRDFRFNRHSGTTESVLLAGCSPDDVRAPACTRANGYAFGSIRTFGENDPG